MKTAMYNTEEPPVASGPSESDPVAAARVAIWRLFQEGYVDEDMATAGLLAVDLGARRAHRNSPPQGSRHDRTERDQGD